MWMTCAPRATVLLAAAIAAGCGSKNAVAPTGATSIPPATAASLTGALSVAAFTLTGWHDGTFHYFPTVSVAAPSTGRTVYVQRIAFSAENRGVTSNVGGITFVSPQRVVVPGGTVDLLKGPSPFEVTSPVVLPSITATVFFTTDDGQTGSVAAAADAPPVLHDPSAAVLAIQAFTASSWHDQDGFHYWPKLTLTETSGSSRALIQKMIFELMDEGPSGRVPPVWDRRQVPAGGTISLVDDEYFGYGPWLELDSTADAARVSVMISFVDDAGRGGSVSAVAQVSR
jgi:hypothetical protein